MSIEKMDKLLKYDPLSAAEKFTGKSYKTDKSTSLIGLLIHLEHSKFKKQTLQKLGDTYYGIAINEFLLILEKLNFYKVFELQGNPEGRKEHFCIYWNNDGILLVFNTYEGLLNSGIIYYNWVPDRSLLLQDKLDWWHCTSSGSCCTLDGTEKDLLHVGSRDVREGFIHAIRKMQKYGTFLKKWQEIPHLWLIPYWFEPRHTKQVFATYADERNWYKIVNREMLHKLPIEIQNCIDKTNSFTE